MLFSKAATYKKGRHMKSAECQPFVGMSAIPHTELARDTGITHRLKKLHYGPVKVIASAIHNTVQYEASLYAQHLSQPHT